MMKRVAKMLSTCDLNEELRSFSSKMEYLSAQQLDVLKAVEHAEIQPGKKRKREVELWCALVEEKKIKFQEIDSEFNNQGASSELKNRLAKEIKEVEGLIQQGKFPSGVVLDNHSATRLEMVVNTLVGSRSAENIEMITKWLKQDDVFAIGVFGMGGVGKTTLLKKIHNSLLCDSDIEGQVYWVTASQNCNLQNLQTAIGKCLGLDISKEDDISQIANCVGLKYVSSAPRCVSSVSSYLDNLECLNLIGLPDLRSIGENGSFSSLPHLKELKIEGCEKVEEIFESNRDFLSAQNNLNLGVALPELLSLDLEHLPKLRNIYSIQLHHCTSLQRLRIRDCAKLEGIVMSPTCDGDTAHIPCFRSLSDLTLIDLPLLSSIYQMRLHHATSLSSIFITDCPKLEGIFTSCTADTTSILTLPKLQRLVLMRLPNLSSVYRGLLMFASLEYYRLMVDECPKLMKMLLQSYQLFCDTSQWTLASLPTESESPEWWEPLHQDFPDDVIRLSYYILQARQSLLCHDNDDHDDDKTT